MNWPFDGDPAQPSQEARRLAVSGGGVTAGFSVFIYPVIAPARARGDAEIRRASILAILVWFIVDSAGSIAAGAAGRLTSRAGGGEKPPVR